MERNVRVVSTTGDKKAVLQTEALTISDLRSQLRTAGYNLSNTKIIEGESQVTFEQDNARLPLTDFTIFIMPVATKSGADWGKAGYKELREEIKRLKGVLSEAAFKGAFGNYTQLGVPELQKLVVAFHKSSPSKTAIAAAPVKKEAAPAVVKKEITPIPALTEAVAQAPKDEVLLTISVPIGAIPTGMYSRILTEREEEAVRRILR